MYIYPTWLLFLLLKKFDLIHFLNVRLPSSFLFSNQIKSQINFGFIACENYINQF